MNRVGSEQNRLAPSRNRVGTELEQRERNRHKKSRNRQPYKSRIQTWHHWIKGQKYTSHIILLMSKIFIWARGVKKYKIYSCHNGIFCTTKLKFLFRVIMRRRKDKRK